MRKPCKQIVILKNAFLWLFSKVIITRLFNYSLQAMEFEDPVEDFFWVYFSNGIMASCFSIAPLQNL